MRLYVVGLLVAVALLVPRIADACGTWGMDDVEKKLHIEWWINAGGIHTAKGKIGHLGLAEEKTGLRVFKDNKTLYDVAGNKLRKYGKPVATFDDTTVSFGKRVYTFAFEDAGDWHGFPSWKVTVKRGDTVVIESKQASALCAGAAAKARTGTAMPDADQMAEVRRRMMFYLAWREVGA
jgi:hypothetical protein